MNGFGIFLVFPCILGLAVYFVVTYFLAIEFYKAAAMKGHSEKKYFWIAFLVPLAGYLLIVALPDRGGTGLFSIESNDLPEL